MTTSTRPARSLTTSSKPSAQLKTLCLTQDDLVRAEFRNDVILAGLDSRLRHPSRHHSRQGSTPDNTRDNWRP
ncbi:hypothetical protein C6W88_04690 [Halomonas litopenaei]|uniref:Uncharacterized protein n=1 Tax=Halomonas litopenaei TaxID=2109328 RepID=A0ABX5IYW6_9GAMM|nr:MULTISPECIES: hypothetical protein [Halomonas]MBS8268572.1 hypothetical protein [Halomonas litopenaei]MBY5941552.1 hypothetical protein [Halomonas sp. DP5N14-9]PTL93679.1 hypothetical protein C6W89_00475 [Halomonas sp. SYSU XM8]PTL95749.1 hypothetical protein C6W88_04690 [Halomonas litopenaei]|tara:strand:- start:369 stop:587 length:219 start_codon:yes stop_codon:yes gene_type:complete